MLKVLQPGFVLSIIFQGWYGRGVWVILFKMIWKYGLKSVVKIRIYNIHKEKNVFGNVFQIDILVFRNMKLCFVHVFLKKKKKAASGTVLVWLHIRGRQHTEWDNTENLHQVGPECWTLMWNTTQTTLEH